MAPSIVIGYDGSDGAVRAVDAAGRLFPGARATVITCWRSSAETARAAGTLLSRATIAEVVENSTEAHAAPAAATAAEGTRRARERGLDAQPADRCAPAAVWSAISSFADEQGADAVVVGARGRSELASAVLGSTSHGLVHHSPAPVLVVR